MSKDEQDRGEAIMQMMGDGRLPLVISDGGLEEADPCCPQPDDEPELWTCKHGITWKDWPDYDDE